MTQELRYTSQFYLTSPTPCPYLSGQRERKVFTHLIGRRATILNEILVNSGFRRSQTIAYRPACEECNACISIRVLVREFQLSRNFQRVIKSNDDISSELVPNLTTSEHFDLFRLYLENRHADGGMADMSRVDFAMMVEESHIETSLIEYRDAKGDLLAVCLTDILNDGLSMVYSFFHPSAAYRSLGTFMILDHIRKCSHLGLPFLYLGYWIAESAKMAYKSRFRPQEHLTTNGWKLAEWPDGNDIG